MGEDDTSIVAPAPAVTLERNSGSQIALALTVFALVLVSNSIINDSWLTNSNEIGGTSIDVNIGLSEFTLESCADESCETHVEEYAALYSNCTDAMEGASSSDKEEACGELADFHNAGYVATIMLVIAGIMLFIATIMHVRSMIGTSSRKPNMVSGSAGIWTGLTVLVWYLMLPEPDLDPEWSQGIWMALIAATSGVIAGLSGTLQSWIDGPPRMRAHGVRAGTGMSEFALKESSCGDNTLSILVDSDLIRVARIERVGASPSIKDVLATRRDSYTGFSHQRIDWLDDFKGIWWVLSGASLISSFMISSLFLIPFTIATLLALLQLMDPERFVVSTNSGNHPFYINRWRSNRELTNLAMDLVDDAMIAVLRGEDLDTEELDARADLIAERFSANREAKQAAEAEAAAQKEAFIEAANPPPGPHTTDVAEAVAPVAPAATIPEAPSTEAEPAPEQPAEVTESEPAPVAESEPEPVAETTADVVEAVAPAAPAATMPEVPSTEAEPATESSEVEWPAPEQPAEVAESEPEPVAETTAPVDEAPAATPAQGPPSTTPATAIPPPPPLPTAMPPPAAAIPPPPPMPAAMPPPPGMGGMPAPPPPMGAAILPPMVDPQPMAPPPPVLVQAAPREENLTDDEKENLLGDLSS